MMIAVNQVVVTALALRVDTANACSSFESPRPYWRAVPGVRSDRTCSIIETDKAMADKNLCSL
jgi:hypothetical protein